MKSHAAIADHPIHPMLVTLPIGGFVASLAADIGYFIAGTVFWYDMAWWAMLFGVVTAAIAAVPGLIDYLTVARKAPDVAPTATAHMLVNGAVVLAYIVNLAWRHGYGASLGWSLAGAFALSIVSLVALGASGWLGGQLVYHFGVGMRRESLRVAMYETEHEEARR